MKCKSKANNEERKKIQPTNTHITKMITLGFFFVNFQPNARRTKSTTTTTTKNVTNEEWVNKQRGRRKKITEKKWTRWLNVYVFVSESEPKSKWKQCHREIWNEKRMKDK